MIPVEFFSLERGLTVHLESKDLVELALRGQRQAHALAEHVLFAEAQDRRPSGCARQLRQIGRVQPEAAKRRFLPVSANTDRDRIDAAAQLSDRADHHRVGGRQRRPAQPLW